MADHYEIIDDTVPKPFELETFCWDPDGPFIYLVSQFRSPERVYFYKYNRSTKSLVMAADKANPWGTHGRPVVGTAGRIYYSPPGGTTYSSQLHASFNTDDFQVIGTGAFQTDETHCASKTTVSGTYLVDRYSAQDEALWWTVTGSGLFSGTISAFKQNKYCLDFHNNPLYKWTVSQADLTNVGGFTNDQFSYRDAVPDGGGNLWVYQSGTDNANVRRHGLWRITPARELQFMLEFDNKMPTPEEAQFGYMRWFADDDSLIISNHRGYVKYSIASNTITHTLAVTAGLNGTGGVWAAGTNFASFHHPDDRVKVLWITDDITDSTKPSSTTTHRYPRFTEIRMRDLTIRRKLISYDFAQEYDNLGFTLPQEAALDIQTGGIWATLRTNRHLAIFFFDDLPPGDGGGGGGGGGGDRDTLCLPTNTASDQYANASVNSSTMSGAAQYSTTNTKKL